MLVFVHHFDDVGIAACLLTTTLLRSSAMTTTADVVRTSDAKLRDVLAVSGGNPVNALQVARLWLKPFGWPLHRPGVFRGVSDGHLSAS